MIHAPGGSALLHVTVGTCGVYSLLGQSAVLQEVEEPQQKGVCIGKTPQPCCMSTAVSFGRRLGPVLALPLCLPLLFRMRNNGCLQLHS